MRNLIVLFCLSGCCAVAHGQDVPPVIPTPDREPVIVYPVLDQVAPKPEPKPEPVAPEGPVFPPILPADTWYCVESDVPLFLLHSPDGLLKVDVDEGPRPMRVKGLFAGGGGKVEARDFRLKYVYFVEPVKAGLTEIVCIPQGVTDAKDIHRQVLGVMGPRPPPIPDVDPEPKPKPKPDDKTAKNVSLSIVEDTRNRSSDTATVLNELVGWTALIDAGNDWRLYDLTTSEPAGKIAVAAAREVDKPAIVIRDKDSGTIIEVIPLPKDRDELRKAINSRLEVAIE